MIRRTLAAAEGQQADATRVEKGPPTDDIAASKLDDRH